MNDMLSPGSFRLTVEQAGAGWTLVSDPVGNQERMAILCAALGDTLPRLGFEPPQRINPAGKSKLTLPVTPPQRRYWSGATLEAEEILAPAATLEVRATAGTTEVSWKQEGVNASATVGDARAQIRIDAPGVVARPSAVPSIELTDVRAVWRQATGELELDASATFENLPPFEQTAAADVLFERAGETYDGSYDPATGRFRTTILLRSVRPRTVELQIAWRAQWQNGSLVSPLTADVPIRFGPAEFQNAEGDFAPHIYLGREPVCVRFAQHEYLPEELVLSFSFRSQTSACRIRHHDDTREPALYDVVDWIGDALADFRRAAPGIIRLALEGETGTARQVMLLPGIIDGTWGLVDNKPAFRLASATLDEALIEKAFDPVSEEPSEVRVAGGVVTITRGQRLITHLALKGGSRVPINARKFSPLFLRDPLCVWNAAKQRPRSALMGAVEGSLAPATHYRASGATGIKDPLTNATIATTVLQAAIPGPALFDFAGRHQLLIYRNHDPSKTFRTPVRGDVMPADKPLGLYFRGFYFTVDVVGVQGDFVREGKLLLLQKPLRLDFGTLTNHIMAFAPLRAAYSHAQASVAVIDKDQRVIVLSRDENGVIGDVSAGVFKRLGYVYGSREAAHWTPAAALSEPWLYTFDNLAFALADEDLSFAGWLLPGGAALFDEQPPFSAYAFDFTGKPPAAVAALVPFPLRVRQWITPLTGIGDDDRQRFDAAVDEKLRELDVPVGELQQIKKGEFMITLPDQRTYRAVCEWNAAAKEVRLLVGPPLRTPEVQFYTLP